MTVYASRRPRWLRKADYDARIIRDDGIRRDVHAPVHAARDFGRSVFWTACGRRMVTGLFGDQDGEPSCRPCRRALGLPR